MYTDILDEKHNSKLINIAFMPFKVFYCSRLEDAGLSETREIQKRIKSISLSHN